MIILTRRADSARMARHRRAVAAQLADAIEAQQVEYCDHRDRPSCARCATRRTVQASARLVREAGGVIR